MNAIRITQKLESDTLYLPQLRPFVGREVEIIVMETSSAPRPAAASSTDPNWVSPLAGSVLEYHDPFEPAASPEEWESNQ